MTSCFGTRTIPNEPGHGPGSRRGRCIEAQSEQSARMRWVTECGSMRWRSSSGQDDTLGTAPAPQYTQRGSRSAPSIMAPNSDHQDLS
jgi:hypothetical protein